MHFLKIARVQVPVNLTQYFTISGIMVGEVKGEVECSQSPTMNGFGVVQLNQCAANTLISTNQSMNISDNSPTGAQATLLDATEISSAVQFPSNKKETIKKNLKNDVGMACPIGMQTR